jgi:hypothetical protein
MERLQALQGWAFRSQPEGAGLNSVWGCRAGAVQQENLNGLD